MCKWAWKTEVIILCLRELRLRVDCIVEVWLCHDSDADQAKAQLLTVRRINLLTGKNLNLCARMAAQTPRILLSSMAGTERVF